MKGLSGTTPMQDFLPRSLNEHYSYQSVGLTARQPGGESRSRGVELFPFKTNILTLDESTVIPKLPRCEVDQQMIATTLRGHTLFARKDLKGTMGWKQPLRNF